MSSGGMSSALDKLDPVGNKITQWGGDPLNLYGNQNNPNAALFPSGTPASAGVTLPAPNGNVNPITYNPNSFAQRQPAGPGAYNAMAAQLAGPVYVPQVQGGAASAATAPVSMTGMPALSQLLAQQLGAAGTLPYNPKAGPAGYAR